MDYIAQMSDGTRIKFFAVSDREADLRATSIANAVRGWAVIEFYPASRPVEELKPIIEWRNDDAA